VPVDTLPVDANSNTYVATMGPAARPRRFWLGQWDGFPIGIPYTTVVGTQSKVSVHFQYASESDPGPYPIPPNVPIEGDPNGNGDRHALIVDKDHCVLYELYALHQVGDQWYAGSGAIFTLTVNGPLRPDTWTSADAAGLPMLPAWRVTMKLHRARSITRCALPRTPLKPLCVAARHQAPYNTQPGSPPMVNVFA